MPSIVLCCQISSQSLYWCLTYAAYLRALDLTKAFDKVGLNHEAIFIELKQRRIPTELIDTLVSWFNNCTLVACQIE
jgi:hypothetical protein